MPIIIVNFEGCKFLALMLMALFINFRGLLISWWPDKKGSPVVYRIYNSEQNGLNRDLNTQMRMLQNFWCWVMTAWKWPWFLLLLYIGHPCQWTLPGSYNSGKVRHSNRAYANFSQVLSQFTRKILTSFKGDHQPPKTVHGQIITSVNVC